MATAVAAALPPYWQFYQEEQARASAFACREDLSLDARCYWQEQARWAYLGVYRTQWALHCERRVAEGRNPFDG